MRRMGLPLYFLILNGPCCGARVRAGSCSRGAAGPGAWMCREQRFSFFSTFSAVACGEGGFRSSWAPAGQRANRAGLRVMAAVFCFLLKPCAALLGPAPPRACMVGHGNFARRGEPRSRLCQRCILQISIAVGAALPS